MDKKAIAAALEEMGTLLELQGANPFKSRAFHNASRAIEGITSDIGPLVASGKLVEIKGIGKSIAEIVTDLATNGTSKELADLRKSFPDGLLDMLRIQGLGPKKVKVLFETLKIRTVDQLEKAARGDKLAALEGFGKKSQDNILAGIAALKSRADKFLYSVAASAATRLLEAMARQPGVIRAEVAGSIRRRKEVIGDIDILVSAKESARGRIMDAFVSQSGVSSVLAKGDTKSSVRLDEGMSCDLRIVADAEFPFALAYFTGSKEHNVELRSRAKKYGWSLNEYAFSPLDEGKKGGKKPPACDDEKEIYRALSLAYVPPELRENRGEIEAAEQGKLPRLIDDTDIRGTFHCHTTDSDGVNTLEEMVDGARALGWEYLGIGDHSRSAAYAGGLTEERVRRQRKAIDALNERLGGFRVFKGTECDILANGDLDWPEKILELFDYVVVSVHSGFNMSTKAMTARVVKAITHKRATMLGHPTGRLLLSREAYPIDMEEVIRAAGDHGKMIEINAHPMRLDLDWRLCRHARDKGVTIVINPDAHNVDGLRDVFYGVGTARKGWLRKEDVFNTRRADDVLSLFESLH